MITFLADFQYFQCNQDCRPQKTEAAEHASTGS